MAAEREFEESAVAMGPLGLVGRAAIVVLLLAGFGWLFDAMVINMFALILPSFLVTYHATIAVGGIIASIFLAGYTVGTFLGGTLADYLGRKRALGISISSYSLGMALSAFAPTLGTFGVLRFLTGLGGGMELPASAVYVTEVWPRNWRARAMGFMHSFYSVGYIVAVAIAAEIVPKFGWRWAFLACVVPGLVIFAFRLRLQESPRYRDMIAALKLEKIARSSITPLELLRSRFRKDVGLHGMIWTSAAWGYWAFAVFAPFYLTKEAHFAQPQVYAYLAGFCVFGILGAWLAGVLADRFGRRPVGMLCPLIAMFAVVAFSLTHDPYAIFIFGSLEFAANSGAWVAAETFTSEAFPTAVRGTAFSTALTIGRIVSIFAPVVVGSLAAATSLPVAYRLSVAPWLLAVVAFALARETRAVELSDA